MSESANAPSMQELLGELAGWMGRAAEDKAEIDKIQHAAANEAAAYVLGYDEAQAEIKRLRDAIKERMEVEGVRTVENDAIQCQRPKREALTVVDQDKACAHLADLGRLEEVQRVTVDEKAVLWIAETLGKLDGVEKVTTYGFAVKAVKK